MNTALYFGSFNPIHLGHTALAAYVIKQMNFDELWFVVSPNNPLKDANTLLDEKTRLNMVSLAIADAVNDGCIEALRMKACDVEFTMTKPSYTCDTLKHLSALFPDNKFSLIIGSDNLTIFHQWREYQYILDNFRIVVYPRQNDNISELKAKYPNVVILDGAPLFNISSTEIRNKKSTGQDYSDLLSSSVGKCFAATRSASVPTRDIRKES